jgi:hypothetical protein
MSNHVHSLVTPSAVGAVAAMMQDVGRRYVRLFNKIHNRSGTLWEGRYKSSLIDSDTYLLTCHRYIELNPVRAGLVEHPLRYPWSSHAHYAVAERNPLITRHALFDQLAGDRDAFVALFHTNQGGSARSHTNYREPWLGAWFGCLLGPHRTRSWPHRSTTEARPPTQEQAGD